MKTIYLICVGKLKNHHIQSLENDYLKRCQRPQLKIYEVKAQSENKNFEASEVIKKCKEISNDQPFDLFTLNEAGQEFNSLEFSHWLFKKIDTANNKKMIFTIAGATGHGSEVLNIAKGQMSLSKMTFPHKLARLIFIEQFYRAQTIHFGHPYHNQ